MFDEKFINRFFSNIDVTDSCWIWSGHVTQNGYGQIKYKSKGLGAHRVSYQIHKGPIPEGLYVCHSCDNPSCVNPDHLWLGTHTDNMRDMYAKGRQRSNPVRGHDNRSSKLTEAQVVYIKQQLRLGVKQRTLAIQYNVSDAAIHYIKTGEVWSHID